MSSVVTATQWSTCAPPRSQQNTTLYPAFQPYRKDLNKVTGTKLLFGELSLEPKKVSIWLHLKKKTRTVHFEIHSLVFSLKGRAWQEPEPGMALAHCILGKLLGVVFHFFPPPLDVPTLAAKCLRDFEIQRIISRKEKWPVCLILLHHHHISVAELGHF